MIQTDLYFGLSKPDGSIVSESEWKHFKETEVARIFKDGSTTMIASGLWYDSATHQLIAEPSYVVISVHKNSPQISKQIDTLRLLYKAMFKQQSILRVDKNVKVSF